jgi:uncharacterized protein (DUF1810 family)
MIDSFDLGRFVQAQDPVQAQVLRELGEGRKLSHWMWFVFPQLRGLGHSAMAQCYGLASMAEAQAYLSHPVLGPRLVRGTALVNAVRGRTINQIFGSPDDMKFHSSMTLFAHAEPGETVFREALRLYFAGAEDSRTVAMLRDQ